MNVSIEGDRLNKLIELCIKASKIVLSYYRTDLQVKLKEDYSPITEADIEVSRLFETELLKIFPDIPVISEENIEILDHKKILNSYWLLDPIDGTSGFISKSDEFVICLGLIQDSFPIFGIIVVPTDNVIYYSTKGGVIKLEIATGKTQLLVQSSKDKALNIITSSLHFTRETGHFVEHQKFQSMLRMSSALKFTKMLEGEVNCYPCFGKTMAWDIAAGQALLNSYGGKVIKVLGRSELDYRINDFRNPHFVAFCRAAEELLTW